MTTAVYILSPSDKIDAFAAKAREREFEARNVFVGVIEGDMRSVVFQDGSPYMLKQAIATKSDPMPSLKNLKARVEDMLRSIRVGYDDLRVFAHFGGQGLDEIIRFNESLRLLTDEFGTFRCYAISFGNHHPETLFPSAVFSPPCGGVFWKMCEELQKGRIDDLEHLRALRLVLPLFRFDTEEEKFVLNDIDDVLRVAFTGNRFGHIITADEREWLGRSKLIMNLFNMDDQDDWPVMPNELSCEDYEFLMSKLLTKGTVE